MLEPRDRRSPFFVPSVLRSRWWPSRWYSPWSPGARRRLSFCDGEGRFTGGDEPLNPEFTCRSARSGSLLAGLGIALLAETLVLHLWLVSRHPLIAWALTVTSLAALAWLIADYQAMGRGVIRVAGDELQLDVGRRFALRLPRGSVLSAVQPEWRDVPEAGTTAAADYLNLMRPAQPNVLLTLREPTRVRVARGIRRTVRRIGLHVDEPQRLVAAIMESDGCRTPTASSY